MQHTARERENIFRMSIFKHLKGDYFLTQIVFLTLKIFNTFFLNFLTLIFLTRFFEFFTRFVGIFNTKFLYFLTLKFPIRKLLLNTNIF